MQIERDRSSIFRRLSDARWVLMAASVMFLLLVLAGQISVSVAVLCLLCISLGACVPRHRKVTKLRAKASVRRPVWPAADMKVAVESFPDPCIILDGSGVARYANKHCADAFGPVRIGDPLSFKFRSPVILGAVDEARASGMPSRVEFTERVPMERWYDVHVQPVILRRYNPAERRQPDFLLVILRDLSELKRSERMRADFVANASHELRTPLASLSGFVETLLGPARDDPEARDRFLGIMLDQAERMKRLIDDLLSLSRIEMKSHMQPDTPIDLVDIINHAVDAMAPLARELDVAMVLDVPKDKALVYGERDEMIQVIDNLIENALKYGDGGQKIDISCRHLNEQVAEDGYEICVRDYGPGIAIEHQPRLTERFYRVDVAHSREKKGTGLGLAIAKHILTRHRGHLTIESEPGEGAAFKIWLPAVTK